MPRLEIARYEPVESRSTCGWRAWGVRENCAELRRIAPNCAELRTELIEPEK